MDKAAERFNKLLTDNNLTCALQNPVIKFINGGGVIVETPLLLVTFTDPAKEVENVEPIQPGAGEQSAEAVE